MFRIISVISFLLIFSIELAAQERLKVGLVLGGGGAKGSAHVGVLKELEQLNIPIDYIAGTSIGAYVGGMYALGYSPAQIEQVMLDSNWDEGYSDTIPRNSLNVRNKQHRDIYNLPLRLGIEEQQLKIPKGLLAGQNVNRLLRSSTNLVRSFDSFDDLAIPFRAIATDLVTSHAVIISSGSIIDAMQASAAVPGVVQPIELEGKTLVDGGIANNLPIDVVKAMGADVVIAVDIGSSLAQKEHIQNSVDVLMQLSTILTRASTEHQLLKMTPEDILIRPDVGALSTTDWAVLPLALERGQQAAIEKKSQLSKLSMEEAQYLTLKQHAFERSEVWFASMNRPLVAIELNNQSSVHNDLILREFAIKQGALVAERDVQDAIDRVYGLDAFETVDATFKETPTGRILVLNTQAKSWGPNFLDVGASYQDDFQSDSVLSLDIAYTKSGLNQLGAQWRNQLSLGYEKALKSEFYQPLNSTEDFYGIASIGYLKEERRLKNSESIYVDLQKKSLLGQVAAGYYFNNDWVVEVGFAAESGELRNQDWAKQVSDYNQQGYYLSLNFDDLNSINFPTDGNKFAFTVHQRQEEYDDYFAPIEDADSLQFTVDWRGAMTLNNHALVGAASFSTIDKRGEFTANVAELGGFLNLSGYGKNTLIGAHKAFAAVIYQYDIGRDILNLENYPLYSGLSIEAGNVWALPEKIDFDELLMSGSVYLGTDTGAGPIALGVGFAKGGETSVFISLGKNWW